MGLVLGEVHAPFHVPEHFSFVDFTLLVLSPYSKFSSLPSDGKCSHKVHWEKCLATVCALKQ